MDPSDGADVLSKLIGLGIEGGRALDDREHDRKARVARAFGQAVGRHRELPGELLLEGGLARWPPPALSPTARREFERSFLLAYLEGLDSPGGRGLDELGDRAAYRARIVRDLLVTDLATWGGRHVFGNAPRERWSEGAAIPFLSLDALYVEPAGAVLDREGKKGEAEPLLLLLERLTAESAPLKVIVVTADLGSGKSLSARMLARRWAERYLDAPGPSRDLPLPVHVRCAEDLPHDKVELPSMLQLAWRRQARALGLTLPEDDPALAWPAPPQRLVCLLDGLDEVALGEQQARALFQKLRARTSRAQRFLVLARSGALPTPRELGEDVTVVRIQPFDDARIERWLAAWNQLQPGRPPLTLPALAERALHEVARTPLLLFLVAFAWHAQERSAEPPSRAELYEHFFQQLTRAKLEAETEAEAEERRPIARAFEALPAALHGAGLLDEGATRADAVLALLGHLAWVAHGLEQERPPEPLTRRHLENLLHEQALQLPASAIDVLQLGLLLAPQEDPQGGSPVLLFGHRSFREFLVGRHWATCLQRLVRSRELEWAPRTEALLGGRLLEEQDRSFELLMQIIHAAPEGRSDATSEERATSPLTWSVRDRELLARWAQDVFQDEGQRFATGARGARHGGTALQDDQRAVLRETALAIGSSTRGSPGISAVHPGALRSMLAWFWLRSTAPRLIAMGAHFSRIQLVGADLRDADLRRADLRDADLHGADLGRANLGRADLRDADLRDANFVLADLRGANLGSANLIGANLGFTDLRGADLRSADLIGADLVGADLIGADLRGADLSSANLIGADLRHANLGGANFSSANLSSANLIGADLRRADLSGTDLNEALLDEERFAGAGVRYDGATTWPDGFDPRRPGKKAP